MSTTLIQQIDQRILSGEYKNFPLTANRLIAIRGKLLHRVKLSENDVATLKAENFEL